MLQLHITQPLIQKLKLWSTDNAYAARLKQDSNYKAVESIRNRLPNLGAFIQSKNLFSWIEQLHTRLWCVCWLGLLGFVSGLGVSAVNFMAHGSMFSSNGSGMSNGNFYVIPSALASLATTFYYQSHINTISDEIESLHNNFEKNVIKKSDSSVHKNIS